MTSSELDRIAFHLICRRSDLTEEITQSSYEGDLLWERVKAVREVNALIDKALGEKFSKLREEREAENV